MATIIRIALKKGLYRKTWFKLNLPSFFKPVFKGKKIVAIEFKSLKANFDKETIVEYLKEKGLRI